MSLTVWQFISQGGSVKAGGTYTVNNIVLTANTNPYPISGNVVWTENYSNYLTWDVNGVPQNSANNVGLDLLPLAAYIQYFSVANTTLSSANTLAQWQANNNIVTSV